MTAASLAAVDWCILVVMMVMGMIPRGLRDLHVSLQFPHDQPQQIGHFSRIPTTSAITNALDLHQRQRSKMAPERRNDGGSCWCSHFLTDNASIGGEAF